MIAIGLMSGTSLDGIDAALVRLSPKGERYDIDLLDFTTSAFEAELSAALRAALPPQRGSVAEVAQLHHRLGGAFAAAARNIADRTPSLGRVDFVASHGQTLFHDGPRHLTLQIGDPFAIREAVRATVCFDFRSADCAAGGEGAPLVPYVDGLLFGDEREDRVALNLGGIANLTALPMRQFAGDGTRECAAFDTGPGNMLIDAFVRERTNGKEDFDRDGALASAGRTDEALLREMLADPYFALPPPKTTGRERFGVHFLCAHPRLATLPLEDGVATLTELTAVSVAASIGALSLDRPHVIVSGGGASNPTLLGRIAARLTHSRVERSDAMGLPADAKEAIAFAILGYETLRGRAANVPRATGAARKVVLGAIAPYELDELLERVRQECRS